MKLLYNYLNDIYENFLKQKIYEKVYTISLYLVYILYILSYFTDTKYLKYINFLRLCLKYYVIIFLIIKFHPFKKIECTTFDRFIIFQSAIFLLLTTNLVNYL